MAAISEILKNVQNLRPLSRSAVHLLELVNEARHNLREVIDIVKVDGVLTTHVLRVANSAAYARSVEITTVDRAVPVLGEDMIASIALGVCAHHLFDDELSGYAAERGALWQHSLRCAIAAREISSYTGETINADLAFTAGIIHDLGKAVISRYLEGHTSEMTAGADAGVFSDYLEAEQQTLGTDHAAVGSALAAHWNLPACLIEMMRHHHLPSHAPEACRTLVYTVHLGDFVAMMGGVGTGSDTMGYKLDSGYSNYVKISRRELECLMLKTAEEYENNTVVKFGARELMP